MSTTTSGQTKEDGGDHSKERRPSVLAQDPPNPETTKSLSLSFKDFRDTTVVPPFLWELRNLRTLSMTCDALTSLPPAIGRLTALTQLNLGNNELHSLPDSFGSLASLTQVELSGNQFEAVPQCLASIPSLTSLSMANNRVSGVSDPLCARLSRLELLNLANNRLDSVPAAFGALSGLRSLMLSGNAITEVPPEIGRLVLLEELQISRNMLTVVPSSLYSLRSLKKLDLSANHIVAFAPPLERIPGLASLTSLNLGDNELDTLPAQIGHLPHLEVIYASSNQLSRLPDLSGLRSTLKALDVRCNKISAIPASVFQCKGLVALDFGYNDLSEVPQQISGLTCLKSCILFGNRIAPSAPAAPMTVQAILKDPDPPAEVVPGVWLGSYMSAHNRHGLRASGVTHILTVAALLKPLFPAEFTYHVVKIEDVDEADLSVHFEECIAFIDLALSKGGGVLIHCAAGISRSATVTIAYLIARKHMTAADALEFVRDKRPVISPNLGFIAQLTSFEKKLSRRANCKHQ